MKCNLIMPDNKSVKNTIVLIGGGHSHMLALLFLCENLPTNTEIILLNPKPYCIYSGMLPGLLTARYQLSDCVINVAKLCLERGVTFIEDTVDHIDTNTQTVRCKNTLPIEYTLLSINTGASPKLEHLNGNQYGHAVKPVEIFFERWEQWLKSYQHPNAVINIVGGGAAGVEISFAVKQRMQHLPINTKVRLISSSNGVLSNHNQQAQSRAKHLLAQHSIELITQQRVISASPTSITLQNGKRLHSDFTIWSVNAGSHSWFASTNIQCSEQGFIKVDRYLRSLSHQNIFASGDCCHFTPKPTAKAGVYAVRQAPILAKNIIAMLQQRPLKSYQPETRYLSLIAAPHQSAILSWGQWTTTGRWIWHWKNRIDQRFVQKFK
jgi:selenide,water dikinase